MLPTKLRVHPRALFNDKKRRQAPFCFVSVIGISRICLEMGEFRAVHEGLVEHSAAFDMFLGRWIEVSSRPRKRTHHPDFVV